MVLVFGECGRNLHQAVGVYDERFSDRDSLKNSYCGEENQINVLAAVAYNPHISSWEVVRDSRLSQSGVLTILKRHKYHPYYVSLHHELHGVDFQNRVVFCQWAR
ncbi:hypothetical protein RN001_004595 [Aquatica leii]|uniref:Uncharacterized protein n=1 Tax=Aquatica leii TaxID=1421715 RepID=A0AAN7PEQ8_9COLE|nr:hypothetical protein RN001_004595 [Aquatica leii]